MRNRLFATFQVVLLTVFLLSAIDGKAQTAGSLDPTFGTNGLVLTPTNSGSALYQDMLVQPDGKIIVVGYMSNASGLPFANVVRFTVNGALDTTFDNDGFVQSIAAPRVVALQTDGKILIGGTLDTSTPSTIGFVRRNINGSSDTTLNAGAARVVTTLGTKFELTSINVQTDGKIIVAGTATLSGGDQDFGVLRYNTDGSLDTTFGTGGRTATNISGNDYAFDAAIQPDGKIVLVGYSTDVLSNVESATIVRYNTNGSLDTAFGNGGKVIRASNSDTQATKVAVQPDGKIIVVGKGFPPFGLAPLRYNTDGTLDTTFESAGLFIYSGIAIQSNGKVVVAGAVSFNNGQNYNFSVLRYNGNGSLDTAFGNGGRVTTAEAGNTADDAIIQPNGKIVAGGTIYQSPAKIVLARYISDAPNRKNFDFDGDGRADLSVFRPSSGTWYIARPNGDPAQNFDAVRFGQTGDQLVPADYDGDGKTDVAVYRGGTWYLQRSQAGFTGVNFGTAEDIPLPTDFDGDGKADLAVFRPSSGAWYVNGSTAGFYGVQFGASGDVPVVADYDGDGKADIAVYRSRVWYLNRSSAGFTGVSFGASGDKTVPADYDGDGKADVAVFRPSEGTWYLNRSTAGFAGVQFGASGDAPTAADYDGDGRADIAVFRGGAWYLNRSTAGFTGVNFGSAGDLAVPNSYVR